MKLSTSVLQATAALLLSGLLGACTAVVDEGPGYRPHRPAPRPEQHACTAQYAPVCARRGSSRRTFSNGCLAERAGYRVTDRGSCRGDSNGGRQTVCTREYAPVCARDRNGFRTFSNACEARAANARVVSSGQCRR